MNLTCYSFTKMCGRSGQTKVINVPLTSTRSVLSEDSSLRKSSVPVTSVCAAKKRAPSKTVKKLGNDPASPERKSSTLRVPLPVPSVRQSSAPARA